MDQPLRLRGCITFPYDLWCKKEALCVYQSAINGKRIFLSFPQYNAPLPGAQSSEVMLPLLPPKFAETWKLKNGSPIDWGMPWEYPSGNSCVNKAVMFVECVEKEIDSFAQLIYQSFDEWLSRFLTYCMLCNKQEIYTTSGPKMKGRYIELFDKEKIHPQDNTIMFEVELRNESSYLSRQHITNACLYASSNKELLIEYQLLLSSYHALSGAQNRQAIIDAAAAIELCLVKQINLYCTSKGINPDILVKKYRTLGDHVDLMQMIDSSIIQYDLKGKVVIPRNDIAHNKDIAPSKKTASDVISSVENCLKKYYVDFYEH